MKVMATVNNTFNRRLETLSLIHFDGGIVSVTRYDAPVGYAVAMAVANYRRREGIEVSQFQWTDEILCHEQVGVSNDIQGR